MSGDLLAFLRARRQEDEHAAEVVHASDCAVHVSEWPEECNCGWPSRVLQEVEAKGRIIDEHQPLQGYCMCCSDKSDYATDAVSFVEWPCPTMRALAWPFSDHADYQAEWAP